MRNRGGQVAASLKPGVSIQQALAELNSTQQHLHPRSPARPSSQSRLHIDPLLDQLNASSRRALAVLLAAGALLLIMASVNIASSPWAPAVCAPRASCWWRALRSRYSAVPRACCWRVGPSPCWCALGP
jgi:hypothetical protein